ncbi:hypothetical protein [Labrenzia sp. OB1]|uniref:hypothetical protein n=1 Tax=Labrenzia sp. OB1 TaxID=1561204 RepID=UPI000B08DF84|nr:hypothetical protein [Labrenzia sp. OB1]
MKITSATIFVILSVGSTVFADNFIQLGDFYLISRDRYGYFVGSHKLFRNNYRGLNKVSYCNRDYFVRSHSVAWTEVESRRGNVVRIEYNFGRGWRPICEGPQDQVTLTDIGIDMSADDVLETADESAAGQSRLSSIGAMFQTENSGNTDSGFHKR